MSVKISELDSSHFGKKIARAPASTVDDARVINSECRKEDIDLVIVRCDTQDTMVVEGLKYRGFEEIDVLVWYRKDLQDIPEADEYIREAKDEDWPAIEKIARAAFANYDSHYARIDAKLKTNKSTEAYVNWATSNRPGTKMLVYDDGWIKGFILVDLKMSGHLYGVDPHTQGQGIGSKLVIAAMNEVKKTGVDTFSISTQKQNKNSIRVWEKLGFVESRSFYTFHKWYKEQV